MPQMYVYLFTTIILNRHVLDSSSSAASSSSLLSQATPKGYYLFICDLVEIDRYCTLYVFCQNSWKESKLVKFTNLPFNGFVANALPWSATHSFFLKSIQKQHYKIPSLLYFEYRSYRYIFDPLDLKLVPLSNYKDWNWVEKSNDYNILSEQLLSSSIPNIIKHGLPTETAKSKSILLGPNALNIPKPSLAELMVQEILHPFYIFQLFSIGVWLTENYYFYAFCIFIISLLSSIQNLFDTRRNYDRLEELSHFSCPIQVFRDNNWILVDSDDLVPGDIYKVPLPWSQLYPSTDAFPPCDSILLYGDCIINESPLTGESIPISKQGFLDMKSVDDLQEALYHLDAPSALSRHLLFSGTRVIQGSVGKNNPNVIAMAIKTGFNSVKGNLVRSMLHPKPHKFKFYQDSFKFIGVMALVAGIGFIYTAYNFVLMGETPFIIFLRGLDLITITVPPALPATMSVGISFALRRLRKMDIFCIAPSRINVAGQINILLFDKTGTLTVDGLKLLGAQESKIRLNKAYFNSAVCEQVDELEMNHPLLLCMAGCHDLKLVNNHLLGDPLEIEMFRFTNAQIKPTGIKLGMELIEIYKIFEFDAKLRKMSVIIKINDVYYLCTKGAPEALLNSFSNTSVPNDFNELLAECSHNGFRVLACGIKTLEMEDLQLNRQQLEVDIDFCGFLIFENKLKQGTTRVVETLNSARIHMAMCTGDNLLTAISVGRECGICVPGPRLVVNVRKTSLILQDVVYDNLFGQEDGFVNMDDEMIPSGSYGASIRRQSYNIRQNSGMSSSSSETSYPAIDPSEPVSPMSTYSQFDLESSLVGAESNFLLFVPFFNNNILEWRSLDVPILKLTKEFEIEITDMADIQHMQYHFSTKFINNLQKQQRYLQRNKELLDNMQSCFAMDGDTFDYLIQNTPFEQLELYLTKCLIFARMSPDQKADLVERLQKYDFTVGFVGDGANDCSALKASDVGLSLSEAEASIAAPFTSKNFEIECVVTLMREGRAALVTSFSCFKYMAMYSFIQFMSVTMLYNVGSNLGDLQFLYVDLILILPLAITMAHNGAWEYLHSKKPTANLLSGKVLTSLFGQVIIQFAFQLVLYVSIKKVPFYKLPETDPETEKVDCFENTVLFINSSFQYIILAFVYSIGPPYRAPISQNTFFIITVMLLLLLTTLLSMGIWKGLNHVMALMELPFWFKISLILYSLLNFGVSWVGERFIFPALTKRMRQ